MKKILSLIVVLITFINLQAFSADIFVQPTMQTRTNEQDRVWVGTFQLAWNDLMDKVIHGIVRFREGNPDSLKILNKQYFSTDFLSGGSYYTYTNKIKNNTKHKITRAINKKFGESSDIIESLDLKPAKNRYIAYAMLKKDFEFLQEFDKLGISEFGNTQTAEYFGVNSKSDSSLRKGIEVLFYNNPHDYAVVLHTQNKDDVYLYKNSANKAFNYIYSDMMSKKSTYSGHADFTEFDELKVPNINFFVEKSFDELTDKRIIGTNLYLQAALETVKFNMDNKGGQIKSEAAITTVGASLNEGKIEETLEPRYFYFDNTFVIFLKETDKNRPYFALRVNDISKFQ